MQFLPSFNPAGSKLKMQKDREREIAEKIQMKIRQEKRQ